ncbi:KAP family P-loop NTPase fold protein [Nisaea sediminum]|uniref:KAP family P-loop NTPase fold protein n=1 Tax=Nisaea sediminum TaxID=2775867 RepID=UPI001868FD1D|nr:P-loop NTPase fold protein [Nisaea sediminum]
MKLIPTAPVIGKTEGFTKENDLFGYAAFGKRLTRLVSGLEQPMTIILDGPWGSGKSTFVKQWAGELRNQGAAVIEFDAFANDHYEDAFVVLAAKIVEQAEQILPAESSMIKDIVTKAKRVGSVLLPISARLALRGVTLNLVDSEDFEKLGTVGKTIFTELGDELAKIAEDVFAERLRNTTVERVTLENFQKSLTLISTAISTKNAQSASSESENHIFKKSKHPLIFIIDDLDRCKPSFALNTIERIKHLFSVNGVVFILVTNIEQLTATVKSAYGQNTKGEQYLEKFYDLRVTLPHNRDLDFRPTTKYIDYLWNELNINSIDEALDNRVKNQLKNMSISKNLSLRTIERISTYIAITYQTSDCQFATLISGLAVIRQTHPEIYNSLRQGRFIWPKIIDSLDFNNWPNEYLKDESIEYWNWFTNPSLTELEIRDLSSKHLFGAREIHDRLLYIPRIIAQLDNINIE